MAGEQLNVSKYFRHPYVCFWVKEGYNEHEYAQEYSYNRDGTVKHVSSVIEATGRTRRAPGYESY